MIRYWLYSCVLYLISLPAAIFLLRKRTRRPLLGRFRPRVKRLPRRPIWVHACSVGEVNTARGFIKALAEAFPEIPSLLTVNTLSGKRLAMESVTAAEIAWAPFDLRASVRGFLKRARPRMLLLVETELWPNLVRETRRFGAPVLVVNGRISPKHFPRYLRYRALMPPVMPCVSAAAVQDDAYAARFRALGLSEDRIRVTGNIKCDTVAADVDISACDALREECGFSREDIMLIFGSTRPGDEISAAACWQALKNQYPELRLIVAPRHLDRLQEGLQPFAGEPVQLRTAAREGRRNPHARVFFLDTMGELARFYALCRIAVIGGSFSGEINGHNPLEPAALGVATLFGPHMGNFPDAARLLLDAGGALQVRDRDALAGAIRTLLDNAALCQKIAALGHRAVLDGRGAMARTIALIRDMLERQDGAA